MRMLLLVALGALVWLGHYRCPECGDRFCPVWTVERWRQ